MTDPTPAADTEYGAKDCPLCGTATVILQQGQSTTGGTRPIRTCPDDDCLWCVEISGTTTSLV